MNSIFRTKLSLFFDLNQTFLNLQCLYHNIRITCTLPKQIIIRLSHYSILIFTTGQCRIMGRLSLEEAQATIDSLSSIYTCIIDPLHMTSQTIVFNLDLYYVPINLYKIAHEFSNDKNVQFEPEIFPALSLYHFKPLHVNVFTSGKVVVLGKEALLSGQSIKDWLHCLLCLT